MSQDVLERKAYFIGQWKGNVVSDNIIQQLRAKSEADRGKKVKVRLSKHGIQIRKSAMFQGSVLFDSYRMDDIYFMTVNQQNKSCLLCIVRDEKHKYSIMAFRCASDYDAGVFVQTFKALKGQSKHGSYEMTLKGDGNWTLHNRSGVSTRQYLQVPRAKPVNGAPNGDIRHAQHHTPITDQTVLPDPDSVTKEEMYLKGRKQHNIGVQTNKSHDLDIDQMSEASDVSAFKDELESLSQELREIKYLLEKSTGISAEEYLKRAREQGGTANNNYEMRQVPALRSHPGGTARVYVSNREPPVLVSHPVPAGSVSEDDVFHQEADYRSYGIQTVPERHSRTPNIKTSEVASVLKREFSSSHIEDTTPRVMAVPLPVNDKASTLPHKSIGQTNGVVDGHVSGGSSVRVKFDPKSMRMSHDQKTRSMRMSTNFMVPSTVEKSIEKTYARPTILRPGYVYDSHRPVHVRRSRPQSVYIMTGTQPLKVQNPRPHVFEAQF